VPLIAVTSFAGIASSVGEERSQSVRSVDNRLS